MNPLKFFGLEENIVVKEIKKKGSALPIRRKVCLLPSEVSLFEYGIRQEVPWARNSCQT